MTFAVQSDWDSGFTGEATVTNTGDFPINEWAVEFNIGREITSFWSAKLIGTAGTAYTVENADWNSAIPVGGSVTFGFNAQPGGVHHLHADIRSISLGGRIPPTPAPDPDPEPTPDPEPEPTPEPEPEPDS